MISYETKTLMPQQIYPLLIGGIGPRPIALVSTVSKDGKNNLAPFSFFNCFSIQPPIIGFSPTRKTRTGEFKDTYLNLMENGECVVQVVTHAIVDQVNLASGEFPRGVDEFIKSGLTPLNADLVKPKRVKESPFQMECKLKQIVHLGDKGGAGNLALCEIIKLHISEGILKNNVIDPQQIDLVGRMGADYYVRAHGDAIFEIDRAQVGVGFDQLPENIKSSRILTARDLTRLASVASCPTAKEMENFSPQKFKSQEEKERAIQKAIHQEDVALAWKILLSD